MPSTATITAFYTFSPNTVIKSADVNHNFSTFRGHFIPVDPNTATAATTKTYDLGSSDYYWRNSYVGFMTADTVSASTIVGTTINATSFVATTATVSSLVATTATVTSLVATNATFTNTITSLNVGNFIASTITAATSIATTLTATSLVATTATVTSLVATTATVTSLVATSLTVSNQIDLTGGKIKFPASQSASADANCLDDYEEGTFNITIIGTSSTGTASYSLQDGWYTKIGRVVTISIRAIWSGHTGSGNMRVAGLPFTVSAMPSPLNMGLVEGITLTANTYMVGYALESTTQIDLVGNVVGGGSAVSVAVDAAGGFFCSGSYFV